MQDISKKGIPITRLSLGNEVSEEVSCSVRNAP